LNKYVLILSGLRAFIQNHGWKQLFFRVARDISRAFRKGGLQGLNSTLSGLVARHSEVIDYPKWIKQNERTDDAYLIEQREEALSLNYRPCFSIVVPTYNTPQQVLVEFIQSVLAQTYTNWELCIADDCSPSPDVRKTLDLYSTQDKRIKVAYRKSNGHIAEATNTALTIANGDYICLMDHDDLIAPNALYEFAEKLNEDPKIDFIYSDEVKLYYDSVTRSNPFFTPH